MKKKDCDECDYGYDNCVICLKTQLDGALKEIERLKAIILSKIPFHPIWINQKSTNSGTKK